MRQSSSKRKYHQYHDRTQHVDRKQVKNGLQKDHKRETENYSFEAKGKPKSDTNPAASLVTQVPQGASKPAVDPNQILQLEFIKEHTVVGPPKMPGKKCLVLDLDETLVHSSYTKVENCDLILPIEIDNQTCYVYVMKRPGVDIFLEKCSLHYELIIYTASLSQYANPLLDWLDPKGLCDYRLFREHCTVHNKVFVKDLSRIARPLKHTIIIDNCPTSYMFHPECAIPTTSWFDDQTCTELYQFIPILEQLSKVSDVRPFLKTFVKENKVHFAKANQVLRGGKIGGRAQSQPHFQIKENKCSDSSKKSKDKRSRYKKRTTSERRNYKSGSHYKRHSNFSTENISSSKYHSKYSASYKTKEKKAYLAKNATTKQELGTPSWNRHSSKVENSAERTRSKHLNSSKSSASDKHGERKSSRKRHRGDKYRQKQASRRRSRGKKRSHSRENNREEVDHRHKERGSSAHARQQSAKDSGLKFKENLKPGNSNCNYRNPDEFHKFRHSLGNKKDKSRRPSSAKRKGENPLKDSSSNQEASPEFDFNSKSNYNTLKNQFLENIESKECTSRENRYAHSHFTHFDSSKTKMYESRKGSQREGKKRSSSRDRVKDSPKIKNSDRSQCKMRQNRSRSRKSDRRSHNKSSNRSSDKQLQKVKPSKHGGNHSTKAFHHTASLKFTNILKDMSTPTGVAKSSQFFTYTENTKGDHIRPSSSTQPYTNTQKHSSRPFLNLDHHTSKHSIPLQTSLTPQNQSSLKSPESFRLTPNTNHHYNYTPTFKQDS
ncbi:unnamed protein product [Moneuplotes crassus]|uniref:FCP1 homology domain-containing protein n=1 Tax=Euplotes crassus TaxID=5936 RepID=A0AAD2D994_EUPCR|nr:unnamed protein product [Moneuplotes crassus]